MAIVTGGYDGTVDEVQFAALLHRYSLTGPDDLKATTQAGDRIVSIGNGTALGPGTVDVVTNLAPIQFNAAATNTTRWDLVALRRDWQPPGGASSIVIIEGGSTQALPAEGTATTAWNRRPGIMDDQPLYLQQVNGTLLGTRIDLRCWASHGGMVALHTQALDYLKRLGARVKIGADIWSREIVNGVEDWVKTPPPSVTTLAPLQVTGYSITGAITTEMVGIKKRVLVDINVTRTGNAGTIPNDDWANFGAVIPTAARGDVDPKYIPVSLVGGSVSTATNNLHATVFLNPSNGLLQIRGLSDFTWQKGALFSLNVAYDI